MVETNKVPDDERIDYRYNLKIYWNLIKRYKWALAAILVFVFLIESTRIVNDFLFKSLIDNGTSFVNSGITADAFTKILVVIAGVFVFAQVVKMLSRWFFIHLLNRFESNIIYDMKQMFFRHLLHLSYNFHTSNRTGGLISKLIRGSGAVERMSDIIVFNFVPLFFQLILVGGSLFIFDVTSAFIVIVMVIVFVTYSVIINKMQQKATMEANECEDVEKSNISDIFTNIESIKYFGKESDIHEKYRALSDKTKKAIVRNWDYYRWLEAGQSIILGIGTVLVIYFPMMRFLNGETTLGTVIFVYTAFGTVFGQLFGFVQGIKNYYRSMGEFESLFRYYKISNDVKDAKDAADFEVEKGEIEFRNVTFSYNKRNIYDNFSLKMPAGKKIAIIGSSGAGKSSLIKLLYRLYDVDSGQILIDGKDIRSFKQTSLRSGLSIVPQECVLFDDTIYNNIAFSNPDATREDVFRAMKFAQLDKIVAKFPNKENTVVGERGVKLSGGEKQRVSIARALLADKRILVLDEATSSLDSETEQGIQRDMYRLMEGRTSIIIAHRLSTIMKADMIVVLQDGKIMQTGTHEELIKKEGIYNKLWGLQKGGYVEEPQVLESLKED